MNVLKLRNYKIILNHNANEYICGRQSISVWYLSSVSNSGISPILAPGHKGGIHLRMEIFDALFNITMLGAFIAIITITTCMNRDGNRDGNRGWYGRWDNGWRDYDRQDYGRRGGRDNRGPYEADEYSSWRDEGRDRQAVRLLPVDDARRLQTADLFERSRNLIWTWSDRESKMVLRPLEVLPGTEEHRYRIYQWSSSDDRYGQIDSNDDLEQMAGAASYFQWVHDTHGLDAVNDASDYPHDVDAYRQPPPPGDARDDVDRDDDQEVKQEQFDDDQRGGVDRAPVPKVAARRVVGNGRPRDAPRAAAKAAPRMAQPQQFVGRPHPEIVARHPEHYHYGRGRRVQR